jgi:hypothetical protein
LANFNESLSYFILSMNFVLFASEQYGLNDKEAGAIYSGWV